MSGVKVSSTGMFQESMVRYVAARWGCGAQPGKYHVFVSSGADSDHNWKCGLLRMASTAVVDDFGNLVRVER